MELSSVELVALLELGDLMWLQGERGHLEISVVEGINCVDSRLPIQVQQFSE